MWPNPQKTVDLVTFTEEILHEKHRFLCSRFNSFKVIISNIGLLVYYVVLFCSWLLVYYVVLFNSWLSSMFKTKLVSNKLLLLFK